MIKRIEAYRALFRAGGEASRRAYSNITMQADGSALAQIATGRRTVRVHSVITDHERRFADALSQLLKNPVARKELRELIDSYGET